MDLRCTNIFVPQTLIGRAMLRGRDHVFYYDVCSSHLYCQFQFLPCQVMHFIIINEISNEMYDKLMIEYEIQALTKLFFL